MSIFNIIRAILFLGAGAGLLQKCREAGRKGYFSLSVSEWKNAVQRLSDPWLQSCVSGLGDAEAERF
mgnify:FL=1